MLSDQASWRTRLVLYFCIFGHLKKGISEFLTVMQTEQIPCINTLAGFWGHSDSDSRLWQVKQNPVTHTKENVEMSAALLNSSAKILHLTLCSLLPFVLTWPLCLPVCVPVLVFVCFWQPFSQPLPCLCFSVGMVSEQREAFTPICHRLSSLAPVTQTHTHIHTHRHTHPGTSFLRRADTGDPVTAVLDPHMLPAALQCHLWCEHKNILVKGSVYVYSLMAKWMYSQGCCPYVIKKMYVLHGSNIIQRLQFCMLLFVSLWLLMRQQRRSCLPEWSVYTEKK